MSWHRVSLAVDEDNTLCLQHELPFMLSTALKLDADKLVVLTTSGHLLTVSPDNSYYVAKSVSKVVDVCLLPTKESKVVVVDEEGKVNVVDTKEDVAKKIDKFEDEDHNDNIEHNANPTFLHCDSGESHVVLRDVHGRCWTWGQGPQTAASFDSHNNLNEQKSEGNDDEDDILFSRVAFLQDLKVHSLSVGPDFNLALAHVQSPEDPKKTHDNSINSTKDSVSGHSCPLGLPILSEITTSSPCPSENDIDDNKNSNNNDSNINSNTYNGNAACEQSQGSESKLQRLSQSGLYLNPSEALNYLSSQLSWIQYDKEVDKEKVETKTVVIATEEELVDDKVHVDLDMKDQQSSRASRLVRGLLSSSVVSRLVSHHNSNPKQGPSDASLEQWESLAPTEPSSSVSLSLSSSSSSASASSLVRRSSSSSAISKMTGNVNSILTKNILSCRHKQLWFWGRGHRGQSGQGDLLDRVQPCVVSLGSSYERVLAISSGKSHGMAVTTTGNAFVWGHNLCNESTEKSLSLSPSAISLPCKETASCVLASKNVSLIMCDSGNLYALDHTDPDRKRVRRVKVVCTKDNDQETNSDDARQIKKKIVIRKLLKTDDDASHCLIMSAEVNDQDDPDALASLVTDQKLFLRLLTAMISILESLRGKNGFLGSDGFDQVLKELHQLIEFVNQSITDLYATKIDVSALRTVKTIREIDAFIKLLISYNKVVCDCRIENDFNLDNSDFNRVAPFICELVQNTGSNGSKSMGDNMIEELLQEPTSWLSTFQGDLQRLRDLCLIDKSDSRSVLDRAILAIKNGDKILKHDKRLMLKTREFWDQNETRFASIKNSSLRILFDSRENSVNVSSSNGFGKEWIVITNESIALVGFAGYSLHPLQTTWIDATTKTEASRHQIRLLLPEENITLSVRNPEEKHSILTIFQRAILESLNGSSNNGGLCGIPNHHLSLPLSRKASYTFHKIPDLRGGHYEGSWLQAKMHGKGTLKLQNQVYDGSFKQNQKHGHGILKETCAKGLTRTYEGEWHEDRMDGHAHIVYENGDSYDGQVVNGVPEGQGILQQGSFVGLGASLYVGEWKEGRREGYGVRDDIVRGDKYMGMWSGDLKNGPGCGVTIDGIYYEGNFLQDKMSGKGLMLFEDDTAYEGEFAGAGNFNGAGVLSYMNGDRLVGNFYGDYSSGLKFSGHIHKSTCPSGSLFSGLIVNETSIDKNRIGKLAVRPDLKWSSLFNTFCRELEIPHELMSDPDSTLRVKSDLVWDHMAIMINKAKNDAKTSAANTQRVISDIDNLERIPDYFSDMLDNEYLVNMADYLTKAFDSSMHPLGRLLKQLSDCFNATYGGVRVHPRLLKHAVNELESIVRRLHVITKVLFPALNSIYIKKSEKEEDDEKDDIVARLSPAGLIHPHVLPRVHSSLFTLYALFYKRDDDEYWSRLVRWNRHSDLALLSFLGVDPKFWQLNDDSGDGVTTTKSKEVKMGLGASQVRDKHFLKAIETLQHLKTKFTPLDKLEVITHTFREVNRNGMELCGSDHVWCMDDLFPVFIYVIVRARILQLGAEIHMIEQLTHPNMLRGEFGIMLTTLQAGYYQIIKEAHFI